MSGGVKNIYVEDCTFLGTDVGLRFKSTRGRGGVVENIYINNINICLLYTSTPKLKELSTPTACIRYAAVGVVPTWENAGEKELPHL